MVDGRTHDFVCPLRLVTSTYAIQALFYPFKES